MAEKALPTPPQSSTPPSGSMPKSFSEIGARTRSALLREDVEAAPSFGVDLVLAFSSKLSPAASKKLPKAVAAASLKDRTTKSSFASTEYTALLERLKAKGLRVTTRQAKASKGAKKDDEDDGKVWVFVSATEELIGSLMEQERSNDFLNGVAAGLPNNQGVAVTPAERLRLVHELLVGDTEQGGLAITPGVYPWSHVSSIFALHNKEVNDKWTQSWLGKSWDVGLKMKPHETDLILKHFGPSLALYFSFLSFYTLATLPLSIVGVLAWAFLPTGSYASWYALAGSFWSVAVVEAWRIKEKSLAIQWGMKGVEGQEKFRAQSSAAARGRVWWKHDLKLLAGLPVLLACAGALFGILTGLFVFEAFVTALYDGFGKEYISLVPTLAFALIVPRILAVYKTIAEKLTDMEDHPTESSYQNALTTKVFALNSIVAFGGLLLSAYAYIPFGDQIMAVVDTTIFHAAQNVQDVGGSAAEKVGDVGEKLAAAGTPPPGTGGAKALKGRGVINDGRLQAQVFAYTVTNQIVNAANELVLPIALRWYAEWKAGDKDKDAQLKRDLDEKRSVESADEAAFLQKVEREALLPEYSLFADYAEMVTQFGYVSLWSICWPLACLPVSINNYFELRSDALKVCLNVRKPIPSRVSTIGPWLTAMTFLSWLSVLTNSTLYSLFHPTPHTPAERGFSFLSTSQHAHRDHHSAPSVSGTFWPLLLVALGASHVFFFVRAVIQYVLRRVLYDETVERKKDLAVRGEYLERHKEQIEGQVARRGLDGGEGVQERGAREFWEGGEAAGRGAGGGRGTNEVLELGAAYKVD